MPGTISCSLCGVPEYISREHVWLRNGDIVHKRDPRRRIAFIESGNIDPLLQNIEQLIGTSIERIVVACVQRNVRNAMGLFVSEEERERILKKEMDFEPFFTTFKDISKMMGRGKLEIVDFRFEGDKKDYFTFSITEPFSIPLCSGARGAGIEAILGSPQGVKIEQVSTDAYTITVFPKESERGFKGRMMPHNYEPAEGGIELPACPSCGCPQALSQYTWHPERGVILKSSDQTRMVLLSPYELDPVFQELEDELGDAIPTAVVEAQRRFTRTGFYALGDIRDEDNLRFQFAFRGLGSLGNLRIDGMGLDMILENTALALVVVGLMQGLFEVAFDVDSAVGWELSDEGQLTIEVRATR
jgi:hypothetical protein